jgi:hypothetical protein
VVLPGSPFRNSIVVAADVACTVAVNVFQPWILLPPLFVAASSLCSHL